DGELSSVGGFTDDSVLLVVFGGEDVEFTATVAERISEDPVGAPARAIAAARVSAPRVCLTTPVSHTCNIAEVIRSLAGALPAGCPIIGGTAGDHLEYRNIRQICGDRVLEDAIPILLICGEVAVSVGIASGWTPTGRAHRVTRADGRRILEIDGRSASEVHRELWGPVPAECFSEYPLAIYPDDDSDDHILRAVFSADGDALVCAADVPAGSRVRITEVVRRDEILDGAHAAARSAAQAWRGGGPAAAFVVTCAGRKWLLGTRAHEELAHIQRALEPWPDLPVFGFYSFGEVLRRPSGAPRFHNHTCVVAVLGGA
ncbi:MAG TPA: FIST N-terminal domain-containing protein, partial [Myxococcota bacterium]|nr:FIST N-terminal domain-containing protein [Myxococcota bacterium]